MKTQSIKTHLTVIFTAFIELAWLASCGKSSNDTNNLVGDPELQSRGSVEITAKLVEVPDGAIFKKDLYDYTTILKYQVIEVHRGKLEGDTIYIGHYNPWKARAEAADKRVKDIGGTLQEFRSGDTHRMALEVPIDDHFIGGIVNKYFGKETGVIHWAVWTNLAD